MKRPLRLLHACGCVLERRDPELPFACCPTHGYGQQTVGALILEAALRPRPRIVPPRPNDPRRR